MHEIPFEQVKDYSASENNSMYGQEVLVSESNIKLIGLKCNLSK